MVADIGRRCRRQPGVAARPPRRRLAAAAALLLLTSGLARADSAAPAAPNPIAQANVDLIITLLRSTLIALQQADITGNYTVLRDLGSPGFHDRNTAADLDRIFAPVRATHIDLAAAAVLMPHVDKASLTAQQELDIAGRLDTRPAPIAYELLFQPVNGVWRLDGISVSPLPAAAASSKPLPPPPAPPAPAPRRPTPAAHPRGKSTAAGF